MQGRGEQVMRVTQICSNNRREEVNQGNMIAFRVTILCLEEGQVIIGNGHVHCTCKRWERLGGWETGTRR